MTVKEFAERLNLKVMIEGEMDREITGCYIGDLLSWVMGRAPSTKTPRRKRTSTA